MGTRWSKGSELWVVVSLGLLVGCGGKYAVGSGENAGQAGEGGAGDTGSGGSSVSGGTGGTTPTAGAGGSAGVTVGGASGASAGGSSAGGSAGMTTCAPGLLGLDIVPASPEVVWDRLCRFMLGETRAPFEPLPDELTIDWVREQVLVLLDERNLENGEPPPGLHAFLAGWAFEGGGEGAYEFAKAFAEPGGNFSALFAEVDGRVSFMSQRLFLAVHPNSTRRAMWMLDHLVCTPIGPPPPDIDLSPVTVPPNKTRRQTVEETVYEAACIGCHVIIDPLGFSLEHYDSLGEYRTTENGLPIDSSGTWYGPAANLTFSSMDDLAPQLLAQCETQACFARHLLEYALDAAYEGNSPGVSNVDLNNVVHHFVESDLALAPLLQAIATSSGFLNE
jgi:hypothetical protein